MRVSFEFGQPMPEHAYSERFKGTQRGQPDVPLGIIERAKDLSTSAAPTKRRQRVDRVRSDPAARILDEWPQAVGQFSPADPHRCTDCMQADAHAWVAKRSPDMIGDAPCADLPQRIDGPAPPTSTGGVLKLVTQRGNGGRTDSSKL
jgi:hypothetical protein